MVTLEPITRANLRAVTALKPRDDQAFLIDRVAFSIAKAAVEERWTPVAIYHNTEPVGFALVGRDECGVDWIDSFMIDGQHQRKGYGRAALQALLDRFQRAPDYRETRLSYYQGNQAAPALYLAAGFTHTGEIDADDEVYMLLTHGT